MLNRKSFISNCLIGLGALIVAPVDLFQLKKPHYAKNINKRSSNFDKFTLGDIITIEGYKEHFVVTSVSERDVNIKRT